MSNTSFCQGGGCKSWKSWVAVTYRMDGQGKKKNKYESGAGMDGTAWEGTTLKGFKKI